MTDADKKPFATAMAKLAVALRELAPDVVQMRIYFEALQDLELEFVTEAAERLMVNAAWFPKVSEWRAAAVHVERERLDAQRAFLRRLPAPLCAACTDTGWKPDGDGVRQCECRQQRRLELLGRRPWPALPEGQAVSSAHDDGALTDADIVAARARLEQLGLKLGIRAMPDAGRGVERAEEVPDADAR